jgi:hypothetical protein
METAGFGKFCLRLIHLAGKRAGGGQVRMDEKRAYAQVERVVILLDRRLEMPEAAHHFMQDRKNIRKVLLTP